MKEIELDALDRAILGALTHNRLSPTHQVGGGGSKADVAAAMRLVRFVPSTDIASPHAATGASFIWPLDRRSYTISGSSNYRGLIRLDEDLSVKIAQFGVR